MNPSLRFAILHHECPSGLPRPTHWDLMFERGRTLRAWAIDFTPQAGACGFAAALADHRLDYLTYEGPLSGDRGRVSRWDGGEYELLADGPALFQVRLRGAGLPNVAVTFVHQSDQRWSVSFSAPDSTPFSGGLSA